MLKILITSAGRKIPLINAVTDAAKRIDEEAVVIAGDIDGDCLAAWYAESFWQMPACTEEHREALLHGCEQQHINVIIPTRDDELLFWSENKHHFNKHGIHVLVPSNDSLMRCYDKLSFSQYGLVRMLPVIPTSECVEDIKASRLVVKERFGSSKAQTMLNLPKQAALQAAANCRSPIYQPHISGIEISADAWLDTQHRVKGIVLRTRDKICASEACVTTTLQDDGLAEQVTNFLECLELTGHVVAQLIIDENQNIHIIECNTRFGGASTLSIKAGLDSFYWSLVEYSHGNVDAIAFTPAKQAIRQIRIPCDHYSMPGS